MNGGADVMCMKVLKRSINKLDRLQGLNRCGERASEIAEVASSCGWLRLCDVVLSLGEQHVRRLQTLANPMVVEINLCPLCDVEGIPSVLEHVFSKHKSIVRLDLTVEQLTEELMQDNLVFMYRFWNRYSRY